MCALRHRRRADEQQRAHQLTATLTAARDQAHADGYTLGWLDGYEQGLRERLDDAQAALGRAG